MRCESALVSRTGWCSKLLTSKLLGSKQKGQVDFVCHALSRCVANLFCPRELETADCTDFLLIRREFARAVR
jgi:hypothetical protein